MALAPKSVTQTKPSEIEILWNDDHKSTYLARNLRLACPCASCVSEMTGEPLLKPETVPENLSAKHIGLTGRYALEFGWSDGHTTGIYTFESLRKMCGCSQCRGE